MRLAHLHLCDRTFCVSWLGTKIDNRSCGFAEQEVFHVGYIKNIDLWHIFEEVWWTSDWLRPFLRLSWLLWCNSAGASLALVATQSYWIVSNDAQFIQDGQSGENNVAEKADDPQFPVQLPSVDVNCHEEEDDGEKEGARNENQAGAVHFHRVAGVHEGSFDEPRQTQAQHVKDV